MLNLFWNKTYKKRYYCPYLFYHIARLPFQWTLVGKYSSWLAKEARHEPHNEHSERMAQTLSKGLGMFRSRSQLYMHAYLDILCLPCNLDQSRELQLDLTNTIFRKWKPFE